MPSVFRENTGGLECPTLEFTAAQLNAVAPGYFGVICLNVKVTQIAFKNTMDADVQIYLQQHGDTSQTKIPYLKLGANEVFNMESQFPPLQKIPAGTWIWAKPVGAAPTSGSIQISYWGN